MEKKQHNYPNEVTRRKWIVLCFAVIAVLAVVASSVMSDRMDRSKASYLTKPESNTYPGSDQTVGDMTAPDIENGETVPETSEVEGKPSSPQADDPYVLESGKLKIESLFQYSGANPDCGWEEGQNIGALVLANESGSYLEKANLEIILSDGTSLYFTVSDLPAEKKVMAFELNNATYNSDATIVDVEYKTGFLDGEFIDSDEVEVSVSEMIVTLENITAAELTSIELRCHNLLDEMYFGGTSYSYAVESLPANGQASVVAYDCVLGMVGVSLLVDVD